MLKTKRVFICYIGFCDNVRSLDLDPFLGPYTQQTEGLWKEITFFISEDLIKKLIPQNKMVANTILENQLEEERQEKIQETLNELAGDEVEIKGVDEKKKNANQGKMDIEEIQLTEKELDGKEIAKPRGIEKFTGRIYFTRTDKRS